MQDNVAYLFNHATTLVFAGRMVDAGTAYEKVLALEPLHGQAHLGLAQLWCQVPGRNHVARLQAALSRVPPGMQRAYLHLALSKELEDLGDYHRSFEHLLAGKTEAKAILAYDPKRDAALFEALIDGMSHDSAVDACCESAEPIFVMGMPRTGTTLVDRILSSHPDVQSAGELLNFGVALKRATGSASPALLDAETVCRGRHVDWKRLGEDYLDSTRPLTGAQLHFVDKQPHNFLYASMIAKALPNARIVCLRRNPLDTCLSNFRQLFSVASTYHGYSFDLLDIGRYYLQFDRLISSLEAHFPGRVLQVDYEELVLNQESQTRKLLAFCGLPWSASCLSFEENLAPVATASVVQVRSKLYDRAIHRWQRYATQLQPVVDLLGRAGVDTRQMAH